MQRIDLNEFPKYSPWISRILGCEQFKKVIRNEAKNYDEYNNDKYASYLRYSRRHPEADMDDIKWFARNRNKQERVCVSKNSKLFLDSAWNVFLKERDVILENLGGVLKKSNHKHNYVAELGTGYGYVLYLLRKNFPDYKYIGGDFSENAVLLGRRLLKSTDVSVVPFNFYDKEWDIFRGEKTFVFTYFNIMQLPKARAVFSGLRKYKERISDVMHIEPIYELHNQGKTLGLMRQRYARLNDYNTDLLSILKKAEQEKQVKIIDVKYDIFGLNPLLPASLIHWRFT